MLQSNVRLIRWGILEEEKPGLLLPDGRGSTSPSG